MPITADGASMKRPAADGTVINVRNTKSKPTSMASAYLKIGMMSPIVLFAGSVTPRHQC